jgi:DNA-binding NtrC family response regulator
MLRNDVCGAGDLGATVTTPPPNIPCAHGDPQKTVIVLAILPQVDDQALLRSIFSNTNWRLDLVANLSQALPLLQSQVYAVVVADADPPGDNWQSVILAVQALECQPHVIVTARKADQELWASVLNLGGYDVVEKPLDRRNLMHVVGLAWLHWKGHRIQPSTLPSRALAATG